MVESRSTCQRCYNDENTASCSLNTNNQTIFLLLLLMRFERIKKDVFCKHKYAHAHAHSQQASALNTMPIKMVQHNMRVEWAKNAIFDGDSHFSCSRCCCCYCCTTLCARVRVRVCARINRYHTWWRLLLLLVVLMGIKRQRQVTGTHTEWKKKKPRIPHTCNFCDRTNRCVRWTPSRKDRSIHYRNKETKIAWSSSRQFNRKTIRFQLRAE